jgi:hypothetical protein
MKRIGLFLLLLSLAMPVANAAQTFTLSNDVSANEPAIPVVGANFANAGPYANYVLIQTVATNTNRKNISVFNLSGAQILIMRDDGTMALGSTPANASLIALSGGSSAGQQGGYWSSTTFKGRLQIYAPAANAFVSIYWE